MTSQPTIVQILPAMHAGGAEQGTFDIASAVLQQGWNSVVVCAKGGQMIERLVPMGVRHIPLPLHRRSLIPWNAWRLRAMLRSFTAPTLLHVRSRAPAWSLALAHQGTFPVISTFHGAYPWRTNLKRRYNSTMISSDGIIAISPFIASMLVRDYGVSWSKIAMIPRGINVEAFDVGAVSPQRFVHLYEQYHLKPEVPVIVLPGRVANWKGQALLMEALHDLKDVSLQVLVTGQPSEDSRTQTLMKEIQAAGMGDRVRLIPWNRDMPALYRIADIVVSCSLEPEAFGRTVAEGMAMERLVVAPRHGGAVDQIDHGLNGFHYEPGSARDLAEQLRTVLGLEASRAQTMTAAARAKVVGRFSLAAMQRETLGLYAQHLRRKFGVDAL